MSENNHDADSMCTINDIDDFCDFVFNHTHTHSITHLDKIVLSKNKTIRDSLINLIEKRIGSLDKRWILSEYKDYFIVINENDIDARLSGEYKYQIKRKHIDKLILKSASYLIFMSMLELVEMKRLILAWNNDIEDFVFLKRPPKYKDPVETKYRKKK